MNKFNTALVFGHDSIAKITPRPSDEEPVISTAIVGGYWRVMSDGKIVRTFTGKDAERKANGYALAMLDERPLQPQQVQR